MCGVIVMFIASIKLSTQGQCDFILPITFRGQFIITSSIYSLALRVILKYFTRKKKNKNIEHPARVESDLESHGELHTVCVHRYTHFTLQITNSKNYTRHTDL